ncbi:MULTISPECIES: Pvc16 family protein [Citricoccus]|uniref:Pvc16 family protein n=1 Tax=Citricoccus TaxID=169133 RepID=UPI000255F126|nr:Pvc16 family protein [Citricoccus sp. CH26A]
MARVDSQGAIGAVTELLRDRLMDRGLVVAVGKPEQANDNDPAAKLNLFLYEISIDASLRNHRLDPDGPDPLWLVVRYLLTAFDDEQRSDSPAAHVLIGQGLVALYELNFLGVRGARAPLQDALGHNPEPLKITFEESGPDLISKLLQGSEETYRLSAAVQVRPILLLPDEVPRYSLLVGMDHSLVPPAETAEPVGIEVFPSLGPRLDRVEPGVFDAGEPVTIHGIDLHLAGLEVVLGEEPLQVVGQRPDHLDVIVASVRPGDLLAAGQGPSAGEHPLTVRWSRGDGRYRSSNLLTAALRPLVTTAALNTAGALVVQGRLLGTEADDVLLALYADGAVKHLLDTVETADGQSSLTVTLPGGTAAGTYQVIVKVNGVQARTCPTVVIP